MGAFRRSVVGERGRSAIGMALSLAVVLAMFLLWEHRPSPVRVSPEAGANILTENHFSPAENLERIDVEELARAKKSVDIAMYAFTDKYIADELAELAHRGVAVRIYRDREQFEQEQRNAEKHHDQSTSDMLRGVAQVRVKNSNRRDLMHLKAYAIDGALLRDGSANWSAAGLKAQDNNARFTNDPAEVQAFEKEFEEMWAREDNEVVGR